VIYDADRWTASNRVGTRCDLDALRATDSRWCAGGARLVADEFRSPTSAGPSRVRVTSDPQLVDSYEHWRLSIYGAGDPCVDGVPVPRPDATVRSPPEPLGPATPCWPGRRLRGKNPGGRVDGSKPSRRRQTHIVRATRFDGETKAPRAGGPPRSRHVLQGLLGDPVASPATACSALMSARVHLHPHRLHRAARLAQPPARPRSRVRLLRPRSLPVPRPAYRVVPSRAPADLLGRVRRVFLDRVRGRSSLYACLTRRCECRRDCRWPPLPFPACSGHHPRRTARCRVRASPPHIQPGQLHEPPAAPIVVEVRRISPLV